MGYTELYNKVQMLVDTQKRHCDICGAKETMDNLIIKYDNGLFMCDDCMLDYYGNFEEC